MAVYVENRYVYLSEDGGNNWFALEGSSNNAGGIGSMALPYWNGRLLPMAALNELFYIYVWPSEIRAGFGCQNIALGLSEPQKGSVGLSVNSTYPAQWRVNQKNISWLSVHEPTGSLPNLPQVFIDSSQLTSPVKESLAVDVFLSYRQSVSRNVPIFVPCYGVDLPTVTAP